MHGLGSESASWRHGRSYSTGYSTWYSHYRLRAERRQYEPSSRQLIENTRSYSYIECDDSVYFEDEGKGRRSTSAVNCWQPVLLPELLLEVIV